MSNTTIPQNTRELKALQLLGAGNVTATPDAGRFIVTSQSDPKKSYLVDVRHERPRCRQSLNGKRCPDVQFNRPPGGKCKHALAVELHIEKKWDMQQFINRRPDVSITDIIARMEKEVARWKKSLCLHAGEERQKATAMALAHVARELLRDQERTSEVQTEQARVLAFQIKYYWPDSAPEHLLSPINSFAANEPASVQIWDNEHGWHNATSNMKAIRDYIENNGLIVGQWKPSPAARRRGESEFIIPIYKEHKYGP